MTDGEESADEPLTIECDVHGPQPSAVVCCHLLRPTDMNLGFVENGWHPDDQQAWSHDWEANFLREQGLTDAFREFNSFAVVCIGCYGRMNELHSRSSAS